jgi:tetratricopeptide (TPR) repeat protein
MRAVEVVLLSCVVLFLGLLSCFSQSKPGHEQQIEFHSRKAAEYLKENRPDLAAAEFRTILAIDPNNVDAHGNLGAVLFFQGAYAEAIPELGAALKLRPTLWKTRALLGIGEKRTGDINRARDDLEKAFPNVPDEKIRIETGMELIEIYSRTGDLDKAAATVSVLRKLEPTDEVLLFTAYRIYSDLANESLLGLSVAAPNSARMHQAMAHELAKRGKTEEAIENYRAALKIDPQLPGLHFELAEMLSTLATADSLVEAEGEYKAALQVNPFDEQSECRLGDIVLRRNDVKEAYERYTRAVRLQPDDPEANIGLAKVLAEMKQPEKAQSLLEHALLLDPTSVVGHYRLSALYRQAGRTADAKRELEEYQKYKGMKEKLRDVYHEMRGEPVKQESDELDSRQ